MTIKQTYSESSVEKQCQEEKKLILTIRELV